MVAMEHLMLDQFIKEVEGMLMRIPVNFRHQALNQIFERSEWYQRMKSDINQLEIDLRNMEIELMNAQDEIEELKDLIAGYEENIV